MTKDVTIHTAHSGDLPVLMQLQTDAYRKLATRFYNRDDIEVALASVSLLTHDLVAEGHYFAVRNRAGVIVAAGGWSVRTPGYAVALTAEQEDLDRREAFVRSVMTHPDHARQGHGAALVAYIERDAAAAGMTRLTLTATLSGIPLYHALGYTDASPSFVELPNGRLIELLDMEKCLDPAARRAA